LKEDPRGSDPTQRLTKKAKGRGNGRNTESFDPADTLVRPDVRVWVGSKEKKEFDKKLKHDDGEFVSALHNMLNESSANNHLPHLSISCNCTRTIWS
jgi:hypothetical protein